MKDSIRIGNSHHSEEIHQALTMDRGNNHNEDRNRSK